MARSKVLQQAESTKPAGFKYIIEQLWPLAMPVGTFTIDPKNVRLHDERNIDAITSSLERFGQRKPIVVQKDGMRIRAGNGTFTAARRLGWTHIAAVIVSEGDIDATAYGLADNRTGELAEWDYEGIASLLQEYEIDPLDFAIGFTPDEIEGMSSAKQWDAAHGDAAGTQGSGGATGEEDTAVAAIIKVRVLDIPHRQKVQDAIGELLNTEALKGLARLL